MLTVVDLPPRQEEDVSGLAAPPHTLFFLSSCFPPRRPAPSSGHYTPTVDAPTTWKTSSMPGLPPSCSGLCGRQAESPLVSMDLAGPLVLSLQAMSVSTTLSFFHYLQHVPLVAVIINRHSQ